MKLNYAFSLAIITLLLFPFTFVFGQSDKEAVTYEELYDEPYAINKLFIHFQPLYGELFVSNVNVGFGAQVNYYHEDKFNIRAHGRKAYAPKFDFSRDNALKNQDEAVENKANIFSFIELGGTYHLKDEEKETETKLILYSKRYRNGNRWASEVPEHITVPSKVREIIGIRGGGLFYQTATNLKQVLQNQNLQLGDGNGNALPVDEYISGNYSASGFYIGGSMSWIKNFAIKPDTEYSVLADDLILTTFLDLMYAPWMNMEDVSYREPGTQDRKIFSTDPVEFTPYGFRAGVEGKFNRELGWAYGGEIGLRPAVQGDGFYVLLKVSLPVYGTNLDYSREAFGK